MTTFKAVVKYTREKGDSAVYIRVTHNRKTAYIKTSMSVGAGQVKGGEITNKDVLLECAVKIKSYRDKLNTQETKSWSVEDVVSFLTQESEGIPFFRYAEKFIADLSKEGRDQSSSNYDISVRSFKRFLGRDINFQDITSKIINSWIEALSGTSRAKQMYPNSIKAIFNSGCLFYNDYDRGIIKIANQPFKLVKIPKAKAPEKRAIPASTIRLLFGYNPKTRRGRIAKDVIMLIFYLVGINTVDLYSQKKSVLKKGKICYCRSKTSAGRDDSAYIEVSIPKGIEHIFEKYKDDENMLSFHRMYSCSNDFNRNVNRGLQSLCEELGIDKVDTYTFRHSWATIACNDCGFSEEDVAFCLNHVSAHKITQRYIKQDYSRIDRINEAVLKFVFRRKVKNVRLKKLIAGRKRFTS